MEQLELWFTLEIEKAKGKKLRQKRSKQDGAKFKTAGPPLTPQQSQGLVSDQGFEDVPVHFLKVIQEHAQDQAAILRTSLQCMLHMESIFMAALAKKAAVCTGEGQFSSFDWSLIAGMLQKGGIEVAVEGNKTTFTTQDPEIATACLRTPGGRSWLLSGTYISPNASPTSMPAVLLPAAAVRHLDATQQATFDVATEPQQRALLEAGMLKRKCIELDLDVQSKRSVDVKADGGVVITAVDNGIFVEVTVKVNKVGARRKFRNASGKGSNFWKTCYGTQKARLGKQPILT